MYAIMMEATISFLGLGDPEHNQLGHHAVQRSNLFINADWRLVELLAPCIALTLLVTGLALLNFAVDEIANPQLRSHKGMKRWKKLAAQDKEEREPELPPQNALWSGDK